MELKKIAKMLAGRNPISNGESYQIVSKHLLWCSENKKEFKYSELEEFAQNIRVSGR